MNNDTVVEFIQAEQRNSTDTSTRNDDDEPTSAVIVREDWEVTLSDLAEVPGTKVVVPRSPDLKREQVVNAFLDAFTLIGGTPRLAIWADTNETEFYKLWAKLAPKQVEQETLVDSTLRIEHVLPKGKLDE